METSLTSLGSLQMLPPFASKPPPMSDQELDAAIERWAIALASIAPQLPTLSSISASLAELQPAIERGYFLPDEDEQVRVLFSRYLSTRAALLSLLEDMRPMAFEQIRRPTSRQHDVFLVAFCTACLLVRTGRFLIDSFRKQRVVWRKLDEAEPRFGIPRKQFTRVYRSLTSPLHLWTFWEGIKHFAAHRDEILADRSSPPLNQIVRLMTEEEPFIETSKRFYASSGLRYRWHSFLRRHHSGFKKFSFGVFRASGSLIAELRWKWKRKRVAPAVRRKIGRQLQPGDVIVTRHDDAASNLFLPGFWPHGALYIGTKEERGSLVADLSDLESVDCPEPCCVLEARKDGVLYRPLDDTLSVDACVVLRPKLAAEQLSEAIRRACSHQGKGYDFEFDFRRSDKLVCTEVIYRAYHGIGPMEFELSTRAGRLCLSAEDILDRAVDGSLFDVVLIYGVGGNRYISGPKAAEVLRKSYRAQSE